MVCVCVCFFYQVAITMRRLMPTKKCLTLTNVVVIGKRIYPLALHTGTHPSISPSSLPLLPIAVCVSNSMLCVQQACATIQEVRQEARSPAAVLLCQLESNSTMMVLHTIVLGLASIVILLFYPLGLLSWHTLIVVCVTAVTVLSLVTIVLFLVCVSSIP